MVPLIVLILPFIHRLYLSSYAYVEDWSDVARLVPRSTSGSALDEMIQLFHESEVKPSIRPPNKAVHRLVYKNWRDIPRLLANPHAVISNLRADAPVFVPKLRVPLMDEEEAEQDVEENEVDNNEVIDTVFSGDSLTVKNLPEGRAVVSEQEIQAAIRIQLWYRKAMKRRHPVPTNNADALRRREIEACIQESGKIQWPQRSFYRLLFLGPLPHVLASLKAASIWAKDIKNRNNNRLTKAFHQELEDILKSMTEMKYVIA